MKQILEKTIIKKNEASVTAKYHIEVPLHEVYGTKCIYKVKFGSKFYIGKAKTFLQSCEAMAVLIERELRNGVHESDMYYYVVRYIIKNRVTRGYAEMVFDGDKKPESDLLKFEQGLLTKYKGDPDCLNNSFDAYIPKWIPVEQVNIFNKWKDDTNKANRNKYKSTNARKKHKGGQLAVRSNRGISKGVRPKKSAGKSVRKAGTKSKPKKTTRKV